MNIGTFTKQENGSFHGSIVTFGAVIPNVAIEKVTANGKGPDYIVSAEGGELGLIPENSKK